MYPLATEAPEVSTSTAKDHLLRSDVAAENAAPRKSVSSSIAQQKRASSSLLQHDDLPDEEQDPFDDMGTLSRQEIEQVRQRQRVELSTSLGSATVPIDPTSAPLFVPPNVHPNLLHDPQVEMTTLDNGVRVVSQETYGQVSTVGVVSSFGSRLEPPPPSSLSSSSSQTAASMTQLIELLSFGDTRDYTGLEITQTIQDWGGTRFVSTGREQSLWCLDVLRPNVDAGLELLLDQVLLHPQFSNHELEEARQVLGFQNLDMPPELLLSEALQSAAFGADSQLGRPHFAHQPSSNQNDTNTKTTATTGSDVDVTATRDYLHAFWNANMIRNPNGWVVAGAGVSHEQLVERARRHLGHLVQHEPPVPIHKSSYVGGQQELRHTPNSIDGFVRVAVAVPTGGWHATDDLVTTCVLQTLLGGGNSFSAGGPGKGMYSRLYREVLNRYSWAESSEAYTVFFSEQGLWGISGMSVPGKVPDMLRVMCAHLTRLALEPVQEEELSRARNMLKCNVLTQLESRIVLFEDLGRQVLTYGTREDIATTCRKIDSVTAQDVLELVRRSLKYPVTLAAAGEDLQSVPNVSELMDWIQRPNSA